MRIGVIGAGAVGGVFAATLDRAGHELAVAARGRTLEAIRRDGLRLTGRAGEHVARVEAGERLPAEVELVLCATKLHDVGAALRASRESCLGTPVLVLQNGVSGPELAREALGPRARILGGLSMFAATNHGEGRIELTGPGETVVGLGSEEPSALARGVAAVLDEAMPTRAIANFAGAQWSKLIANHLNALPAILGTSVQDGLADPRLVRIMAASMREGVRAAAAEGVELAPLPMLWPALRSALASGPLEAAATEVAKFGPYFGEVPNPGSTLQSLRRGVPTENAELGGRAAAVAESHGLSSPVTRALEAIVDEIERGGAHLSHDELAARIALLEGA